MIEELVVTNLGVIADVRLEPGPSLVVLTGETGAGKTLLLGALRLLLGGQASDTKVGPAGSEARVEGRFRGPDGVEIVAARRLVEGGRSRAYLDGAMVPAKVLDQNAGHLIEVVGQHDRLLLAQPAEVRSMLDRSLDRGGRTALSAYRETWATLQALRGEQQMAGGDPRALQRELDLVTYQVDEIQEAGFEAGDDDTLGATASRLRNSEELAEGLAIATHATAEEGGAADKLGEVVAELRRAAALDPSFQQIASQAEEVAAAVAELSGELRRTQHQLEREPAELDHIESRLALLSDLNANMVPASPTYSTSGQRQRPGWPSCRRFWTDPRPWTRRAPQPWHPSPRPGRSSAPPGHRPPKGLPTMPASTSEISGSVFRSLSSTSPRPSRERSAQTGSN